MKRLLTLALAMLLLTSCAATGKGSATTVATTDGVQTTSADTTPVQTEPTEVDILADLGEKNFGGRTFTILDANDYPDMHINMPEKEQTGDTIKDAIWQRDVTVSERYGCKIEYVQITNATKGIETLTNDFRAGDASFDLCISTLSGGRLANLATQGILANLCEIETLSLQENWWSRLIYENCRVGDRMYFTTGDIAPATYDAPSCIILNRRLLSENQIETDFYRMVREGKWTVDEMIAVTKDTDQDLNHDGTMHTDHDFFGVVYDASSLVASMMLSGCGVSFCSVKDDTIEVNLDSERTMHVAEKLTELTREIKAASQNDIITKAFKNDRAIALIHCLESAKNMLRDMESDYIILPMPKYDAEQDSYRSMVSGWVDCFVGIPNNVDFAEVGFFAEALARESYRTVRPQTYDLVFKLKGVREEGRAEMIDLIFNTLYIDFMAIYNFGEIPAAMQQVIFKKAPFASTVANRRKLLEGTVNRFVQSWMEIE